MWSRSLSKEPRRRKLDRIPDNAQSLGSSSRVGSAGSPAGHRGGHGLSHTIDDAAPEMFRCFKSMLPIKRL